MSPLERALEHLDGYRVGNNRYAYKARDEGRLREYTLTVEEWWDLGERLERGESDAYSHWCAATTASAVDVTE